MEQRLDDYLAKLDRWDLQDEYLYEMEDTAVNDGTDVMTLMEKTPFEDWLRKRTEARYDCPG